MAWYDAQAKTWRTSGNASLVLPDNPYPDVPGWEKERRNIPARQGNQEPWYPDHTGVDYGCTNERVTSAFDGVVRDTGFDKDAGNFIVIYHPARNQRTTYYHLSEIRVTVGQVVKARETIAISGNTGASEGPHLHVGLIDGDGTNVNKYQNGAFPWLDFESTNFDTDTPNTPDPQPEPEGTPNWDKTGQSLLVVGDSFPASVTEVDLKNRNRVSYGRGAGIPVELGKVKSYRIFETVTDGFYGIIVPNANPQKVYVQWEQGIGFGSDSEVSNITERPEPANPIQSKLKAQENWLYSVPQYGYPNYYEKPSTQPHPVTVLGSQGDFLKIEVHSPYVNPNVVWTPRANVEGYGNSNPVTTGSVGQYANLRGDVDLYNDDTVKYPKPSGKTRSRKIIGESANFYKLTWGIGGADYVWVYKTDVKVTSSPLYSTSI